MPEFEAWMRGVLQYTHYSNGWFWWEYRRVFGEWPTNEMKLRGKQMREEYLNGKA